jgi:hypothetical protein
VEGRKGVGKSTLSLHMAEEISKYLAQKKGGVPADYFSLDNLVSVERDGAITLLTSGRLKRKYNIFILDDVSVQWNSRNAMTVINKTLNDILTISRVYRSILICNLVARGNSDLILRQLTDFVVRITSKNTLSGRVLFKLYRTETNSEGKELLKFLTWKDPETGIKHRIRFWVANRPSKEIDTAYKKLRQKNTDEFIATAMEKVEAHRTGLKTKKEKVEDPLIDQYRGIVGQMYKEGLNTEQISRKTGLTRWWITKCQQKNDGLLINK